MRVTEAYPGNYIGAIHLLEKDVTLTIKKYDNPNTVKAEDGRVIDKAVLWFEETDKGLILIKTNAHSIALNLGKSEMDDWIGEKITLFATTCESFGKKNVPCVRVRSANIFGGGDK